MGQRISVQQQQRRAADAVPRWMRAPLVVISARVNPSNIRASTRVRHTGNLARPKGDL